MDNIEKMQTRNGNPQWLLSLVNDDEIFNKKPMDVKDLLENSLYYPCAYHDSSPIDSFCGVIHSFVYVDIMNNYSDFQKWIRSGLNLDYLEKTGQESKYSLVKARIVNDGEIFPEYWRPKILPNKEIDRIDSIKKWESLASKSFNHWSIWKKEDLSSKSDSNVVYFSLLYFGGSEMNAIYQAVYNRLNIRPIVLSIIEPGMGFWDEREVDDKCVLMPFFEKVLLANKEGLPEYLFSDRYHFLKFRNYYEQTDQFYNNIISSYHGKLYVLNR